MENDRDDVQTLRNIWQALDDMHTGLVTMCNELEDMRDRAAEDDGLSDDDRDNLLSAIERAIDELSSLESDCYDPACGAIDAALDAFKRLPMSE